MTDWLLHAAAKLAAELIDDLDAVDLGSAHVVVELRATVTTLLDYRSGLCDETVFVRRIRANDGEWTGTDSEKRERFA